MALVLTMAHPTLAETPQKTPSPSRSLEDLVALFPSPEQLPAGMVLAEEGSLTASELAATFPDPDDAAQVLTTWGWALNAYRVYVADPSAGSDDQLTRLEISLHQFSTNSMVGCADLWSLLCPVVLRSRTRRDARSNRERWLHGCARVKP